MNKLFQQLSQNQPSQLPTNLQNIKKMMNTFKMAQNPQQMLQSEIVKNPQMKQVIDLVKMSGGDPKTAFYKLAEQRGVNPNDILNALK